MGFLLARLKKYFAEVPGSIRGFLNVNELVRVLMTSIVSGGGVLAVLQALAASAGTIFPAAQDAALAALLLTSLLEVTRRLQQGVSLHDVPRDHPR